MNQILQTNLKHNSKNSNLLRFKKFLNFQFYFSITFIIFIGVFLLFNKVKLYTKEKYSKQILNNYNITKLYSNLSTSPTSTNENLGSDLGLSIENSYVIGVLKIPTINVNYPIFSNYNDDLLKISLCRFYGPLPGKVGNLCIAGHNYDNDKFFSKISSLNINDEIIICDSSNRSFFYYVSDIYEVKSNDLSPIYSNNADSKELTLVTCNNFNNNRIIVKAFY